MFSNRKSQTMVDLIITLFDVVNTQYKNLKRALIPSWFGKFYHDIPSIKPKFEIDPARWTNKTHKQQKRHFERFLKCVIQTRGNIVTSSDRLMTALSSFDQGKKKNKKKRKINSKTTTRKRKKIAI